VLVIGRGAVAIFAAATATLHGRKPLLVGSNGGSLLSPMREYFPELPLENTLVPIFPPAHQTELGDVLATLGAPLEAIGGWKSAGQKMTREYRFEDRAPAQRSSTPSPDSFAAYASAKGRRTEILARKQYGETLVSSRPLRMVQEKTERNYGGTGDAGSARLGYVAGRSRYAIAAEKLATRLARIDDQVVGLEPLKRSVRLRSGQVVRYEQAVFTGRCQVLASMLEVEGHEAVSAPAHFCVCRSYLDRSSRVIYDLRPDSPILRVISTDQAILVAQLSQPPGNGPGGLRPMHSSARLCIQRSVEALTDGARAQVITGIRSIEEAYPVEPLAVGYDSELTATCQKAGIRRFGRSAEWKYLDLHELDWSALRAGYELGL
jgi:hypothetical protein